MLVAGQIRAQKNFRLFFSASLALAISLMCDWKSCPPPTPKQWSQFIAPYRSRKTSLFDVTADGKVQHGVWSVCGPIPPPHTNVIVILETLSAGGPNDKMGGIRQSIWGRGGDNPLIRTGFCALGRKSWKSIFRLVAEQSNLSGEQVSYRLAKPLVLASHIEWWQLWEGDALSYRGLDGALKGADLKSYSSLKKSTAEWFVKGL